MYDLIIIGGGPGGVTAGIYSARQRLKTLVITKGFGGQMAKKAVDIENYPGFVKIPGIDLVKKFEEHLRAQDVEIKREEAVKVNKTSKGFSIFTGDKNKYESKAVILASGADPRPLEVPGEKEFIGKGVSYCSVCDGPIYKDKTIVIVGGGNSGFETALFLKDYVKKIYILEYGAEIKAEKASQEIVGKSKKIKIMTNTALREIKGTNFVEEIIYEDLIKKEKKNLKVEGVFVEIGTQPATSFVKDLVSFNERDEIKVESETCQTKTPGLYAIGDLNVGKYKQIVTACGEGAKAALAAFEYIKKV
ncbi:MAG: FAD-dependent oxidoreductase [Candidatus Nealsonbacteria bacterium]